MAKNNLFLGTASKSVGDVVLMRRNGVQVSRVRVRNIKNPRTESQARQRMILASVTRFYAPLAVCLETSFQGKNKSESYSAFLKANLNRAKALNFAAPRDGSFIPMPVQVSNGTLPSAVYSYDSVSDSGFKLTCGVVSGLTVGAVSSALKAYYGLRDGDQVTFIYAIQRVGTYTYSPSYFRMFIDTTDPSDFAMGSLMIAADPAGGIQFDESDDGLVGFAVIFSRWENNQWRRSSQFMAVADGWERQYASIEAQERYLPEWMTEKAIPVSDVYLNGATSPVVLRGWKLTQTGARGDLVEFRAVTTGELNSTPVIKMVDAVGNEYLVSSLNTISAAYHAICPLGDEDPLNPGSGFDYTQAVTLTDSSNVNLNGDHGATAVEFLMKNGVKFLNAVDFGKIDR